MTVAYMVLKWYFPDIRIDATLDNS